MNSKNDSANCLSYYSTKRLFNQLVQGNTWLQAIDWDATKSLWTLLNDLGSVKATKWNMKCRRQRRRKFWENTNFYLQTLSPHPPPLPSLTISQKFGGSGRGSFLNSSKKKRCRLEIHLSFTALCLWQLLSGTRGEICQCLHCQRQCKIFASGVNFSRNNAVYYINESTKYILSWFHS